MPPAVVADEPPVPVAVAVEAREVVVGVVVDVVAAAAKQDLVDQINRLRVKKRLNKAALAERAGISRMQLDRTLDPDNTSASLKSIARVAAALSVGVYFRLT